MLKYDSRSIYFMPEHLAEEPLMHFISFCTQWETGESNKRSESELQLSKQDPILTKLVWNTKELFLFPHVFRAIMLKYLHYNFDCSCISQCGYACDARVNRAFVYVPYTMSLEIS